jgi:hypothetical protein
VQPLPLLDPELARVSSVFEAVSRELAAAVALLASLDVDKAGADAGEAAVIAGLADLRTVLTELDATTDDFGRVVAKHSLRDPALPPATPGDAGAPELPDAPDGAR